MLKKLAAQGAEHRGAFVGTTLYWVGDVACLWACLRVFHDSPDITALVIGYATGYALTRRTLPLGGAGSVEALVSFALAWTGIPLAKRCSRSAPTGSSTSGWRCFPRRSACAT
ncbi:MAG: flippase-like domain-containing protein [Actinobacteria bacterium]|nr:flippase-like domain-containing protein [Actinomycetota bacterium]